jgi:hypothetical protein
VSEGEDPRRLPGGGAAPVPPEPVQVQWPQTVAVIFNPSSGGDSASERGDRIRQAIQETGKQLIWLGTTREDSGQGLAMKRPFLRQAPLPRREAASDIESPHELLWDLCVDRRLHPYHRCARGSQRRTPPTVPPHRHR